MTISTKDAPWPIGLDRFQQEVGRWAETTFPQSTKATIVAHLLREVAELDGAQHLGPPEAEEEEAADCFLLLLHFAHKRGFSLLDAADRKMVENRLRRWGKADAAGVVEHVREGGPAAFTPEERGLVLDSAIASQALSGLAVPREVAARALDEAERRPLPDIGGEE